MKECAMTEKTKQNLKYTKTEIVEKRKIEMEIKMNAREIKKW